MSVRNINMLVNPDMKHLIKWLHVYLLSLNVDKTELVIVKYPGKIVSDEVKIKLFGIFFCIIGSLGGSHHQT